MAGRKGFGEELKIKTRYAALSEPYFNFIKEMLDGPEKEDRKWAAEQLSKAFVRMIPNQVTGEDGGPVIIQVTSEGANKYGLNSNTIPSNDTV
jgi:hypothetical protein